MNNYYLTLVLRPDIDEAVRKEILESLTKRFGSLEKEDLWGVRDLAYPIKKQTKGWYGHYQFMAEPATIKSLDNSLKLEEDVLRYLLIRR